MSPVVPSSFSPLELHTLLALAQGPLHGYAIKAAVETESGGSLHPGAGSLYRVLARLMAGGLVHETPAPTEDSLHPGLARRYYELTAEGTRALAADTRRLRRVTALAAKRLGAKDLGAGERSS